MLSVTVVASADAAGRAERRRRSLLRAKEIRTLAGLALRIDVAAGTDGAQLFQDHAARAKADSVVRLQTRGIDVGHTVPWARRIPETAAIRLTRADSASGGRMPPIGHAVARAIAVKEVSAFAAAV